MIRRAAALAVFLHAAPASAMTCITLSGVLETPVIKRLHDSDLEGFLRWFNAQPPESDYEGPVWFFDVPQADKLAFGVLQAPDVVCFHEVTGRERSDIWHAVRGI